jgi:CDP-paratose 2-epimerase
MAATSENHPGHILVTGGAGFIGANLAAHLLAATDARITILDNLSHPGAGSNVQWLRSQARATRLRFLRGDVRSPVQVIDAVRDVDEIYHLATRSVGPAESQSDFDVNVTGTLNVLEAARCSRRKPMVFYLSTAKVYNALGMDSLEIFGQRVRPIDRKFRGISERTKANFTSPFICSKGAADRYVLDYARFYNLPTVVLRPDTVAGPRQFENDRQGWVAQLVYSVLDGRPIIVDGSGLQVCDVLHVGDLVEALMAARHFRAVVAGNAYNIGGGASNTASINEMISLIECVCHRTARVRHAQEMPEGRLFYMSDNSAFVGETGWMVRRSLPQTVRDVAAFWHANQASVRAAMHPMWQLRHSQRKAA